MHRCLRIHEILVMIFQECYLHRSDPMNKDSKDTRAINTICSLIRTCKTFHGPAADILWRRQSSLIPLLQCMPSNLWKWKDPLETGSRALTLERKVVPTDFSRLDIYGPRIFYLSCSDTVDSVGERIVHSHYGDNIDFQSLYALKACRPNRLLPNLRQFDFSYMAFMRIFPVVGRMLGPKLEVFSLKLMPSEETYSFLRLLIRTCPNLRELSLSYTYRSETIVQIMSDAVHALPKLEKFIIDRLLPDALVHLAKSPKLRSLRICNPQVSALQSIENTIFVNLHELDLTVDTVHAVLTISTFIQLLGFRHLQKLCMTLKYTSQSSSKPSLQSWLQCLSTVAKYCASDSLEYLRVGTLLDKIDADLFSIPLKFRNLKHVHITSHLDFGISDDLMGSMVLAWPKLEVLCLEAAYTEEDEPCITANALIHLLKSLPSLRYLSLPAINLDERPRPNFSLDDQGVGPLNHAITTLGLGNTPVEQHETHQIGYFLLDLLPNLETIYAWCFADTDRDIYMSDCWGYIHRHLELFKRQRRGEFVNRDIAVQDQASGFPLLR